MYEQMSCYRCGNQDQRYFAYDPYHHNWYCRKCIAFGRMNANEPVLYKEPCSRQISCQYTLSYPLTAAQKQAISEIRAYEAQGKDVLIYAACGAGKTELVMDSIQRYLNEGKKVGFAISRRQVVLEIRERMAKAFPMLQVIAVCEGYTEIIDGDLIICTMHQLYRYPQTFDLLIMDEIDAFPYRGNALLETIAKQACKGQRLYLTATPDESMRNEVKSGKLAMVELFQRPHGYPLIVPKVIHTFPLFQYGYLLSFLYQHKKTGTQVLVFVPTIKRAKQMNRLLKWYFRCHVFTSQTSDKETILDAFHQQRYDCLICTTVLERGITIKGIDVIILHGDHEVFQEASLIQIIGRVGRSKEMPTGKGVILCTTITKEIKHCIKAIQKMNANNP